MIPTTNVFVKIMKMLSQSVGRVRVERAVGKLDVLFHVQVTRTERISVRVTTRTRGISVRVMGMLPQLVGFVRVERVCFLQNVYL
jgi:hypothetical protein